MRQLMPTSAGQPVDGRRCDFAADPFLEMSHCRDVVGLDVHIERVGRPQAQRLENLQIAVDRVDDRVDKHRLAGGFATGQVGVRVGNLFGELSEDHRVFRVLGLLPSAGANTAWTTGGTGHACTTSAFDEQCPVRGSALELASDVAADQIA